MGGSNKVSMADLRAFFVGLGYADAKTLLATGNVIFSSGKSSDELAQTLQNEAKTQLGLDTDFMVRSKDEIESILDNNPFPQEAIDDPSHLLVLVATGEASHDGQVALRNAIVGREYFECRGPIFYFVYPDNIGDSKLSAKIIERHLGVRVTGRNWNTMNKILAAMKG